MDNKQARELFLKKKEENEMASVWATMYGGNPIEGNWIINIPISRLTISKYADRFIYRWGFPGPDATMYDFKDYGISWAFTIEDFPDEYKNFISV